MSTHATTCPRVRRVGLLTAGGDCPGLNAVIRAVYRGAASHGVEVVGFDDGFVGLIEDRARVLTDKDVVGILLRGGTILGSNNKADPERYVVGKDAGGKILTRDAVPDCVASLARRGCEALIVVGGDGSHSAALPIARKGVPIVGVPKTIDNDIVGTEVTFGFQTAVETATRGLDQVRTTAESHGRIMVVEVMGRNAGWIALHAGVASGSDAVLLPEIPFDFGKVAEHVRLRHRAGKRASLICVSEGARPVGGKQVVANHDPTSADPIRLGGIGKFVADELERRTGIESRYVILGHTQRGGSPVPADRVLGTLFGSRAVGLLRECRAGRMVAVQDGKLTDVEITTPAGKQRTVPVDDPLIASARAVGTVFGD